MRSDTIFSGLFIIAIGTVLLLKQLSLLPFIIPGFLFSWPTILIIVGIFIFITPGNKRVNRKSPRLSGLIVMGIGILFLIKEAVPAFQPFQLWPVFIIISGLFILFRSRNFSKQGNSSFTAGSQLEEVVIFSGSERKITTENFSGGKITTIFGGSEIDLLQSDLAPGVNYIDVNIIFGGAVLLVPDDWKVKIEVAGIFGMFMDKRRSIAAEEISSGKELVIRGASIFGGGELKSYRSSRRRHERPVLH